MSVHAVVLIECEIDGIPEAAQAIADLEGVSEVYSVAGEFDLVAIVRVANHDDLASVIPGGISKVDGVAQDRDAHRVPGVLEARPRAPVLDRVRREPVVAQSRDGQVDRDRRAVRAHVRQVVRVARPVLLQEQPSRERVLLGIVDEPPLADQVPVAEPQADGGIGAEVLHPVALLGPTGEQVHDVAVEREPDLDRVGAPRTPSLGGEVAEVERREASGSTYETAHTIRATITATPIAKKIRSPRLSLPGCIALNPTSRPLGEPVDLAEPRLRQPGDVLADGGRERPRLGLVATGPDRDLASLRIDDRDAPRPLPPRGPGPNTRSRPRPPVRRSRPHVPPCGRSSRSRCPRISASTDSMSSTNSGSMSASFSSAFSSVFPALSASVSESTSTTA